MPEAPEPFVDDNYKEQLFESFFSSLPESFQGEGIRSQIRSVYDFAYKAHYGVRRKCGNRDPYITHPVAVAKIVANEIGLGVSAVMAALLHDVVEDTQYTRQDIAELFGESIANIVEGLTNITNVYNAQQNTQAETFKKMILSIPHDPRVAFIKLADRLHNMRTMEGMPEGTRAIKAGENLYVYVPIAYQLGLYDIKNELEDLSFKYTLPENYAKMLHYVESTDKVRNRLLRDFKLCLMRILVKSGQTCKISVVSKSLFQIYSVMVHDGKSFEEINNYQSVRIIFTPETDDPAEILKIHYTLYASVIGSFSEITNSKRDYVVSPKSNGFKALVFQVNYGGKNIEVQILTDEDDMVAHRGYSLSHASRSGLKTLMKNLKKITPDEEAGDLLRRFRSLANVALIYVFTPRGDILELPKGSTVLDFAFAIHEKMGKHCVGAVLGHNIVSINHVLKTADQVNVITSPSARPHPEWHGCVQSDKARQWLENYFKDNTEKLRLETVRGRQEYNKLLCEHKIIPNLTLTSKLLLHYRLSSNEELYQKIARREISPENLLDGIMRIKSIMEDTKIVIKKDDKDTQFIKKLTTRYVEINYKQPLLIDGTSPYILSSCCCPIPGDDSIACTDEEGIIFIHKRECENARKLTATRGKKTTKVLWGSDLEPTSVSVKIQGMDDRYGILKDISTLLSDNRISVKSINLESDASRVFRGVITMIVMNTAQLSDIISKITAIKGILKAFRVHNT